MAYAGSHKFEERLTRIEAKRRKIAKGAIYSVNHDGLIIARPRRRSVRFPVRILFLAIACVFLFKATVLATIGAGNYNARVATLAEGTSAEKAAAWVMSADSATVWLATQLKLVLR
ncbi:hypothetical protein [Celeribacter sp.]|uniref:hypothetical protein n=1 Tax=Celeribacter sp. TaxID=1890673 RepID=UPI003A8EBF98